MVQCCSSHGDIILTFLLAALPDGILFPAACRHQILAGQAVICSCSGFGFSYVVSGHWEQGQDGGLAALILALTIHQFSVCSQNEGNGIS